MPVFIGLMLASLTAVLLVGHLVVKPRFAALKTRLPDTYRAAIAGSSQDGDPPRLVALCIDLIRKSHCTDPFDSLSTHEKKMALHALAVEELPMWVSKYAALTLARRDRALIAQMRLIKASRPAPKPAVHFGAIQRQLQLRQTSKG